MSSTRCSTPGRLDRAFENNASEAKEAPAATEHLNVQGETLLERGDRLRPLAGGANPGELPSGTPGDDGEFRNF